MEFSEKLKFARTKAGYSQKHLATKLFISQQAYAKYETGTTSPNPETLKKISELLGVSVDYLLGDEHTRTGSVIPVETNIFSMNLKDIRKQKGLSQAELAKKIGVSRSAVSMWEIGASQPDNDLLLKMSRLMNVSIDALLGNEPDRPASTIPTA